MSADSDFRVIRGGARHAILPTECMESTISPEAPEVRLEKLLRARACIVYHQDLPDPEYPHVRCSIFGAPKTNELFVQLTNGKVAFVAVTQSPVSFPAMADRLFGMDPADHAVAFALADKLWDIHRSALATSDG